MFDYEKLGVFYLGATPADANGARSPILYDAKDLTTHALCLGMTGSGKTGLGIALLEEAAIDGIPSLVIDPKGDMTNLLLTFPELKPSDFRPWIDESAAARKGITPDELAERTAANWRKGLASWDEPPERIARLKAAADFTIYTPGGNGGRPLSIFSSFDAPAEETLADATALHERISSVVSGILSLASIEADPIQSREHILLSEIVEREWRAGRALTLAGLIGAVQAPPFETVGVLPLESFYPAKDRFALAMRLNNLAASPSFAAWREGESMDVQRLLYTPDGRARVSIFSIAHLSESERMFFVTVLLNEVTCWMRRQPGTSSLRALLYMDEIFGYFPPTANPPSKAPMLTLLKQARAFGLGVVLSTQNPVDIDYRGLSNIGTWFIGRLQTERDKMRVMEGLLTADEGAGDVSREELAKLLAGLGNRIFLMRNVHEARPVLFESRFCLSYLAGPLTPPQIRRLVPATASGGASGEGAPAAGPAAPAETLAPAVPAANARAAIVADVKLHYVSAKQQLDCWQSPRYLVPCDAAGTPLWEEMRALEEGEEADEVPEAARLGLPAPALANPKMLAQYERTLKSVLRYKSGLTFFSAPELKLFSRLGEEEGAFRIRAKETLREARDKAVEKMRAKYAPKTRMLKERERKALAKVESVEQQAKTQSTRTLVSFGTAALSILLGRKAGGLGRATTGITGMAQGRQKKLSIEQAKEDLESVRNQLSELESEVAMAMEEVKSCYPDEPEIVETPVAARTADTLVRGLSVVWRNA